MVRTNQRSNVKGRILTPARRFWNPPDPDAQHQREHALNSQWSTPLGSAGVDEVESKPNPAVGKSQTRIVVGLVAELRLHSLSQDGSERDENPVETDN